MIDSKIKIIEKSKYDSILIKGSKDYKNGLIENRLSEINSLCPKGIRLISKPIFDKNFTIAFFDIQRSSHLRNPFGTYRLKNGKWEAD
jgi:hypothetical protein